MNKELEKLPFWEKLTEDEKQIFLSSGIKKNYKANSYLIGDNDCESAIGLIHIVKGEIRAYITSTEGREITLFNLTDNENCVLSTSCAMLEIKFDIQFSVSKNSEVIIIPSNIFKKVFDENIYVRCFSYELTTKRFSQVMFVMQQILFCKFDKRLASFLVNYCENSNNNTVCMTQEEIASIINSAREVVGRTLKSFEKDGLIENKRGEIIVKDIVALKKI